ncbi:hypothetical protein HQ47_01750 [Porphyromonas macacae]|uniref:Uncharacterized protein n=1 Tax=Porphyromonas macacae TaxID=28115 RepID=A0A0A2E966_9PORP|nr:hypothetical protein HQ47_01750 [Porphyromonas macacae]
MGAGKGTWRYLAALFGAKSSLTGLSEGCGTGNLTSRILGFDIKQSRSLNLETLFSRSEAHYILTNRCCG